jgi:hypothetical protein
MQFRELYHGTNGDNILNIIDTGMIRPNESGNIFFSQSSFEKVLMHGPDSKRKATFAVKLLAIIPPTATCQSKATHGVPDTLVVTTGAPLDVVVQELYVREPRGTTIKTITGKENIVKYLSK